jgi:hypothetical protein
VISRDTSADALEEFLRGPANGKDDYSRGLTRRDCPFPPDSSAALSWLSEWDAAAEHASWLLRQHDAGHLRKCTEARELLLDLGRYLRDLRPSKAIAPYTRRHRDLEEQLQRLLNDMPSAPSTERSSP